MSPGRSRFAGSITTLSHGEPISSSSLRALHDRADDVVDLRLERQRHLVAIGDLDRLLASSRPGVPRCSCARSPDATSTCRRGSRVPVQSVMIRVSSQRQAAASTSSRRRLFSSRDVIGIAHVERAGDRGHRQAALAERLGDPDARALVELAPAASAAPCTTC